jgi:hypothetical protein
LHGETYRVPQQSYIRTNGKSGPEISDNEVACIQAFGYQCLLTIIVYGRTSHFSEISNRAESRARHLLVVRLWPLEKPAVL